MAKQSAIQKNKRRQKLVQQYAEKRAATEGDCERFLASARRAFCGAYEAGETAAQFFEDPNSQPL